jgi:hypothetical protein
MTLVVENLRPNFILLVGLIGFAAVLPSPAAAQAPPVSSTQHNPANAAPESPSSSQQLEIPSASTRSESEKLLEVPQLATPEMPPMPPAIKSPAIPPGFFGCWRGDPGRFDSWHGDPGVYAIGVPGEIYFCYQNHAIELQSAEIMVSRQARIFDIARHLGLGYTTFRARGIKTDVYLVTTDTLRSRSYVDVEATDHLLYLIPIQFHEHMVEDEVSKLTDSNTLEMHARFVLGPSGKSMWGNWHADFQRVANVPGASE